MIELLKPIATVAIICTAVGCANVQKTELAETKDDGTGYTYVLESRTPMFGSADSYSGDIDVGIDADGTWHVRTGQAAVGLDNTGQIEGVQSIVLPISLLLQLVAQRAVPDATSERMAEIDLERTKIETGAAEVRVPNYDEISAWAAGLTKAQKKKLIESLGG